MEQKSALLPGVFRAVKKDGSVYYRASLTYKNKHISLGSYKTAEEAHRAYLQGSLIVNDYRTTLVQYKKSSPLSFEKWVVLLNFRDNDIYFSNPIYIGQKMFFYYLSPSHVLKFDMDDLFYFSSHKIMQRGNHYFAADYGMQVNIVSRFDIKNYAVVGRDYIFVNGDSTDFRRENIHIINRYHGVSVYEKKASGLKANSSINKNQAQSYCARIHINGNYLIGVYSTPTEAAIAYNKAIDILKKNGLTKNYQPNYIDDISPREYAELYLSLPISKKIETYRPTSPNNQ